MSKRRVIRLLFFSGFVAFLFSLEFTWTITNGYGTKVLDHWRFTNDDVVGAMVSAKIPRRVIEDLQREGRLEEKSLEGLSEEQREKLDVIMYRYFWGRIYVEWGLSEIYMAYPYLNFLTYVLSLTLIGGGIYLKR
ncbi:MAG: hypothetical protein WA705_23660 [Candidatus Ozemobacteraceae bacterium]